MGEICTLRTEPPAGSLMPASSLVKARRLLLAAPRGCMRDLQPLVRAWRSVGVHVEHLPFDAVLPDLATRVKARDDLDAVLFVGPARRAPATVLTAPFAMDRSNRRVPI